MERLLLLHGLAWGSLSLCKMLFLYRVVKLLVFFGTKEPNVTSIREHTGRYLYEPENVGL